MHNVLRCADAFNQQPKQALGLLVGHGFVLMKLKLYRINRSSGGIRSLSLILSDLIKPVLANMNFQKHKNVKVIFLKSESCVNLLVWKH